MKYHFISILFLFFLSTSQGLRAQKDSIYQIDEVLVHAHFSDKYQAGYSITYINDSILKTNTNNLVAVLKKYANVYIKEHGSGMVASISMRGSGASHTGVFWNGIAVNSSLNGQTDFNTISPSLYNSISIRKGGGSVLLGSGAIGGAINLENQFVFDSKTSGLLTTSIGSYKSYMSLLSLEHSSDKIALQANASGLLSENDYPYQGSDLLNENGQIKQLNVQIGTALKLNEKNQIFFKGLHTNSDRNTSESLYTTSNANLIYKTSMGLVGWKHTKEQLKTTLKTAYLKEDYIYTFDKNFPNFFSDNGSTKWFNSFDINYAFKSNLKIFSGLTYESLTGKGTDIQTITQQKIAIYSWLHHKLSEKLIYNVSIRKEWSDVFSIPVVFAVDSRYDWNNHLATKINFSTNYKTPTINDLFWQPGGNPDLVSEESWNTELGQEWKTKNTHIGLTLFGGVSTNLIQWKPNTNNIWQPINIQEVTISGLEISLQFSKSFNQHKLTNRTQYSYTISRDDISKKQLLYVPFHIGQSSLEYAYKEWQISYDFNYTGEAYTTTTNTQSVEAYWLSNIGVSKSFKQQKFRVSGAINNLFNKTYQVVSNKPMPNRNYKLTLVLKF